MRNSTEPRTLSEEKINSPLNSSTPTIPRKKTESIVSSETTGSASCCNQESITDSTISYTMALPMEHPSSPGNSSGSDNDTGTNSTTSTALRRLYFKSGRVVRTKTSSSFAPSTSTLPKVVVIGSSTVSATEINTSTESASTLITNVTVTDTSEIGDSLDMGDTSGLTEPLLNSLDDSNQTSTSMSYEQEITTMELSDINNRHDECLLEEFEDESTLPTSPKSVPQTAPICTSSVHFSFDPPSSPKSVKTAEKTENIFTFKNTANYLTEQQYKKCEKNNINHPSNDEKFVDDNLDYQKHHLYSQLRKVIDKGSRVTDWNWGLENNKKRKETSSTEMSEIKNVMQQYQFTDEVTKKQKTNIKVYSKNNRYNNNAKTSPKKDNPKSIAVANNNKEDYIYNTKNYNFINKNTRSDLTTFTFHGEAINYDENERQYLEDEKLSKNIYHNHESSDNNINYCESVKEEKLNTVIYQKYALEQNISHHVTSNNMDFKSKKCELIDDKSDIFFRNVPSDRRESCCLTPKKLIKESRKKKMCSKFFKGDTTKLNDNNSQIYNYNNTSDTNNQFQSSSPTNISISDIKSIQKVTINTASTNFLNGVRGIPTLPDLRVDFFKETSSLSSDEKVSPQKHQPKEISNNEENLYNGKKLIEGSKDINVTANPLEIAVCTQPRATIVVQQPSLSMDNTVETILLTKESDFVSVEQSNESKTKEQQREENMRQLLDVTNTLSFQEIRDFEMRYGSPHHCRSQSVKTPGSRASGRPNQLSLPQQRSRVASMPNTGVEKEYYRLRHFSITGKGVVNRGDSLKSRRSRSITSVTSSNSSTDHLTANPTAIVPSTSCKTSATCSLASSRDSSLSNPGKRPYSVLMLGGGSVGKSSLVSQFMTSEYLHAYDTSIDDESGDKTVSVLLNGEESELVFIDHTSAEFTPENCIKNYDPHGYCVIYSSADRCSFHIAETILQILWTTENIAQKAVILVANKADLARCRVVSYDEGKAMATAYDCKFIETSVGINHNVDELLVGLLTQIRLKLENPEKSRDLFRKRSSRRSKRRACSPLGVATGCLAGKNETNSSTPIGQPNFLLTEIDKELASVHNSPRKYRGSSLKVKRLLERVWIRNSKSKSCENLHVL